MASVALDQYSQAPLIRAQLERLGLPKTVRVGRAKTELRKMASAVKNSDWQRQLETALDGTQDESVEASADLVNRLGRAMVTASISLAEPSMGASAQCESIHTFIQLLLFDLFHCRITPSFRSSSAVL